MKKLLLLIAATLPVAALAQNTGIGTTSPTDQLHTTGTVRFEGYRGPGTRVMQIDSSGRMIVTGAGAISTAYPAAAIPDAGCATGNGVTSTINITGQPTTVASSKIAVRINITHPSDNDLRILLVAPNGAVLLLTGGVGNNGANLTNTVFTDASQYNLSGTGPQPPFTGKYKPVGSVATICLLAGTVSSFGAIGGGSINPNGAWSLKVYDGVSGNTGTLAKWEISFSGPESFTTADQNNYIPRFNSGNLDASNIYQDPASGNIGINGSSASYPLTLNASGNGIVQSDAANQVQIGTYTNVAGGWLQTFTNNPLLFTTNNAGAQMALSTSGNLGVGLAANMAARLHVLSSTASLLQLENTTALSATSTVDMAFKNGSYYTGMIRTRGTGTNVSAMGFYTFASAGLGSLYERMTILDNGNVGIGQTAPVYNLDVTGSLRSTAGATVGGQLTVAGATVLNGPVRIASGSPAAGKVLVSDATGNASWGSPVAFRAYLTSSAFTTAGSIDPLAGYTITYDPGNIFNASTGYFTAPVAGLYHFDVKVSVYNMGGAAATYNAFLVNSGTNQNAGDQKQIDFSTNDVLYISDNLNLAAGETVKIAVSSASSNGNHFEVYGGFPNYSLFSGYLVR